MSDLKFSNGAIAFIDILGFKDAWNQHEPEKLITLLEEIVAKIKLDYKEGKDNAIKFLDSKEPQRTHAEELIRSGTLHSSILSDTFVIGVKSDDVFIALKDIGFSMISLMKRLFEENIFIRGAVSYGSYYSNVNQTVFIGEAVDDVAQWFGKLNMLGVMATPKTHYLIESNLRQIMAESTQSHLYINYNAPTKNGDLNINCLNWPTFSVKNTNMMCNLFSKQKAFDQNVFHKYENTLKFMDYSKNHSNAIADGGKNK